MADLGERTYNQICYGSRQWMWGDRLFAASAFELPPLGRGLDSLRRQLPKKEDAAAGQLSLDDLYRLEHQTGDFCAAIAKSLGAIRFAVAGATSTFEQTAAGVALLRAVKRAKPQIICVIGGANCEGELAEGIASLGSSIDYIFSGECEAAFPEFLSRVTSGEPLPRAQIIYGSACLDMDALPEHVRPLDGYSWAFPPDADTAKLAYHFQGEYPSAHRADSSLLPRLTHELQTWQQAWSGDDGPPPVLVIGPVSGSHCLLMDTRGLAGLPMIQFLTIAQARAALLGAPLAKEPLAEWAIAAKLAVALDGWSIPLAVTDVETWRRFQSEPAKLTMRVSASLRRAASPWAVSWAPDAPWPPSS